MGLIFVITMLVLLWGSSRALRVRGGGSFRLAERGMALSKTNPNRRGRTLAEGSPNAGTNPGARWASTGLPYNGIQRQKKTQTNVKSRHGSPRSPSLERSANESTDLDSSCLPNIPGINSGVVLERGKARLFQDGNPLIYGGAIASIIEPDSLSAGEEVAVVDHFGNCVGRGVFNPHSQYRVRVLARFSEKALFHLPLKDLLIARLKSCISVRASLALGVASEHSEGGHTDVFRLCNGEGDRMGGLVIDVLGRHIVIQASALWCEVHKETIITALQESLLEHAGELFSLQDGWKIFWRQAGSRLRQDGYTGEAKEGVVHNTIQGNEEAVVRENGVLYYANAEDGQKTGFYADQRENRRLIRGFTRGKTVLDTFCYTGGFSINAALGGASRVTCVDSSSPALDVAKKNLELNDLHDKNIVNVVKADAIAYMLDEAALGNKYDIVICDPPKLAPSRSTLPRAKGKYTKINTAGLSLVSDGGLFLTCTCSGAMTQQPELFLKMIQESARNAGVEITVLSTTNAAPDHTLHASYTEGKYLTAVLCGVSRQEID